MKRQRSIKISDSYHAGREVSVIKDGGGRALDSGKTGIESGRIKSLSGLIGEKKMKKKSQKRLGDAYSTTFGRAFHELSAT